MRRRLQKPFYERDTVDVARALLGKRLVHRLSNGVRLSGRIVETEAYLGFDDPAAHSFGGRRTPRTEPMFGEPGLSYVYFIYGVYYCFNVVTARKDVPEAVLVRALEPLEGIDQMPRSKPGSPATHIANGPGKLCIALRLGRAQNALDLTTSDELWIEEDLITDALDVVEGARVGIGDLHDAVYWPLRFGLKGHASLSPRKFTNYHLD
ncbi:MAG: DNA-3-methyladenine glycosylase [Bdellovibrionaceae bacterium]|nr:DNA-3-methyladenine glycosylase [Pseudobdellovibrionaceae bacterium]